MAEDTDNSILGWLDANNVRVRKAFDGSKSENQPATVTWSMHDSKLDRDYYLVDAAVKATEIDLLKHDPNQSLLVMPILEWHRDTTAAKPTNVVSLKANVEYRLGNATLYSKDGQSIPSPGQATHTIVPYFILTSSLDRDFAQLTSKAAVGLRVSLFSNKRGLPGAQIRASDGTYLGQYYPYLGADYNEPVPGKGGASFFALTGRLYADYTVLHGKKTRYVEVILDYTFRRKVRGDNSIGRDLALLSVGVNVFLEKKERVAIGYEYRYGHDSKDDYALQERSTVGIKIKI